MKITYSTRDTCGDIVYDLHYKVYNLKSKLFKQR